MTQYINKSALVAEIEKRIKEIEEIGTYLSPKGTLTNLLCYINTLEVKEADWQEKPVNRTPAEVESAMQEVEEKSMAFTEAHKGESSDKILAQTRGEEPVSDDLEEEIKRYVYDPYFDLNGVAVKGATSYLTVEDVADIARHFANWQKQIDLNDTLDSDAFFVAYMRGAEEGKKMMKQQIINKACKFLKSYRHDIGDGTGYISGIVNDKTIEDFKKYMED